MAIDFSYIDHDVLGDVADAIRFVEGSTAGIAPADYPQRIRALDKYIPDYDVLNFTMPNGGTISLNKTGNPTVVELEYWLDENGRWIVWQPDSNGNRSLTLTAGQKMYVRNTSETSTMFSRSGGDYYKFAFTDDCYADGPTESLLCKNYENAIITDGCYRGLFDSCSHLITPPLLTSTELAYTCYYAMFLYCNSLVETPILKAQNIPSLAYYSMFLGCTLVNKIVTYMTSTQSDSTDWWLYQAVSTGDFYCPAELTISTGVSGIPSGWTRHDINELNS